MNAKKLSLPKKEDNFSLWYNELINKAELAENSAVRGAMTIKPYGFAIWENIKNILDEKIKETGHQNAYFPLLIPKSFFSKEENHIKGFAKECAVITHYRLKSDEKKGIVVDETAKLEEELIIRPTSEAIIWNSYKNWIQSYRDLPLLINQWANVMRWEMRPRLFLRTSEILWQEGHTAHASENAARIEVEKMLNLYHNFGKDYLSIPFIKGIKSEGEKFAGADTTYTIEAMMQDGKALQAGTSHFLGQNFAKAFDVKFLNEFGKQDFVWGTSWGITTRLIGAIIMTHSDNLGLVLPPQIAPIQIVIIPIYKNGSDKKTVDKKCSELAEKLKTKFNIRVKFDNDDRKSPGWKFNNYEMKGVPLRIVIGPNEVKDKNVELYRRDTKEKKHLNVEYFFEKAIDILDNLKENLYKEALEFRLQNTVFTENFSELKKILENKKIFVETFWNGDPGFEKKLHTETKATIRCIITQENNPQEGICIHSGEKTKQKILIAQAY